MEIPLLGVDIPTWIILLLTLLVLVYQHSARKFRLIQDLGVPGPRPFPIIGTSYGAMLNGIGPSMLMNTKKYGRVYGAFTGTSPVLVVSDTEILKHVLVSISMSWQ